MPKKRTIAQTPAPKKDKIYGSKVNPKGSASSESKAKDIVLDAKTIIALTKKLTEFKKSNPDNKKITLADLKAVFRRGAGAYSKSHRPTISGGKPNSRNAWAFARVNKFLEKASGKQVKKAYVQDDDLLKYHLGGDMSKHLAPNGRPSNLTHEQWHLVRTPEFKAWFGDWENDPENASKVVDENGEPLVLWHFSKRLESEIERFNIFNVHRQLGSHFGSLNQVKNLRYIKGSDYLSPNVLQKDFRFYEVFLNIRNPIRLKDVGIFEPETLTDALNDIKILKEYEWEHINNYNRKTRDSLLDRIKHIANLRNFDGAIYLNRYESSDDKSLVSSLDKTSDIEFKNKIITAEDSWIAFYPNQIKLADGTNTTFDPENEDIRYENGGEIDKLIEDGVVELKMYDSNNEHSKIYGFDSQKPLYIQSIIVSKEHRNKGIGSNVMKYIVEHAKNNGNDLIIGHITQKAEPSIDAVKSMLIKSGFNTIEGNNDFYKIIYADGGQVKSFYQWYIDWYKGIKNDITIMISLPNELRPFAEENVVILDKFKKDNPSVKAYKYMQKIVDKADEFKVTIYLEPKPIGDTKTKSELIDYYKKLGFELTANKEFMKRLPKYAEGGEVKGVTEIVYEDNGDTIVFGTKTNRTKISVKGMSKDEIAEELEFEKQMLKKKKETIANFNENEIRFSKGLTEKEKIDVIKMQKQNLLNVEKVEKIVIPFYESKLNSFKEGGQVDDNKETYKKWRSLVNMSAGELDKFYNSKEGKEAGLTPEQAKEHGIDSGRESARWIMKMKKTPVKNWTEAMWKWARKQISFISRMRGNKGGLYDDKGNKTRKHTSLLIWGHNPEKYKSGGETKQKFNTPIIYHEKDGNFFVGKNTIYFWLYDVDDANQKLSSGEYDFVMFPPASINMAMQRGFVPPLQLIWTKKYQNKTKGSEHLIGIIEAYLDEAENKLYIKMMTTNPKLRGKGVMSYMIKELRDEFNLSQEDIIFVDTTKEGKRFEEAKHYEGGGELEQLGLTEQEVEQWKEEHKINQKQKPIPVVMESAKLLSEGKISQEEYLKVVRQNQPIKSFTEVPQIPTLLEIVGALKKDQIKSGIIGYNKFIDDGEDVATRLDINAYEDYDIWVVSVHDGSERNVVGYGQSAYLKDVRFIISPRVSLRIATKLQPKSTIARMRGSWINKEPEKVRDMAITYMNHPDWVQVGMNPYRHSWFYDKSDGMPLLTAEEVIQVGALVLAKNPVKTTPDNPIFIADKKNPAIKFEEGGLVAPNGQPSNLSPELWHLVRTPEFKAWFGDWENDPENASKIVNENGEPLICFHGTIRDFYTFDKKSFGTANDMGFYGAGFYFTFQKDIKWFKFAIGEAGYYGDRIIPCFIKAKNPFIFNSLEEYKGHSINYIGYNSMVFLWNLVKMFPQLGDVIKLDKNVFNRETRDYENEEVPISVLPDLFEKYLSQIKLIDKTDQWGQPNTKSGYVKSEIVTLHSGETWDDPDLLGDWQFSINNGVQSPSDDVIKIGLVIKAIEKYDGIEARYHPEGYMTRYRQITELIKENHDCIMQGETGDELVVFEPTQIKLADGTNTTFDPENEDIRYRHGGMFKSHKSIEQIAKEKNVPLSYAKEQLKVGMKVESEHSNSKEVQETIALQHLNEMIDYYKKLETIEN